MAYEGPTYSTATGKIAEALAAAQAEMQQPKKDRSVTVRSDKGSYEFSYATLDVVIEAARGPLTKNGIAFVQATLLIAQHLCVFALRGDGLRGLRPALTHGRTNRAQDERTILHLDVGLILQPHLGQQGLGNDDPLGIPKGADGDVHGDSPVKRS